MKIKLNLAKYSTAIKTGILVATIGHRYDYWEGQLFGATEPQLGKTLLYVGGAKREFAGTLYIGQRF